MFRDRDLILKLEVPIIVQLGQKQMPLGEVLAMMPGAIIELPKKADEELELLVNNRAIGTGIAVKVGENFGLQLQYIGDVRQRIEAMGGRDGDPAATPAPPSIQAA